MNATRPRNRLGAALGDKPGSAEVILFLKEDYRVPLYPAIWEQDLDLRQIVFVGPSKDASPGSVEFKFVAESRRAGQIEQQAKDDSQ